MWQGQKNQNSQCNIEESEDWHYLTSRLLQRYSNQNNTVLMKV